MDLDEQHPPATTTLYRTLEPNASLALHTGRIRIRQGIRTFDGKGHIELRWLPRPRFRFEITDRIIGHLALDECEVELPDLGWSHRGAVTRIGRGIGGIVDPYPGMSGYLSSTHQPVAQVRAQVPNFPETLGRPLARSGGNGWYSGRQTIDAAPWRLTLDDVEPPRDELQDLGGYALTHVLVCERRDGTTFDPSSAVELLRTLDLGLSFCLGSWTGCILLAGYDSAGALVWQQWRMPWLASYAQEFSWLPRMPSPALSHFLAGFTQASALSPAREVLGTCVHWYIEANAGHGGLEGAMTMALMGLELLSWLDRVVRKGEDPKVFKTLYARTKIRDYLVGQGVLLDVSALPNMAAFVASEHNCADGLEAATRLRNRTVHPQGRTFSHDPIELREEAWRYTVSLLERALQKESGYSGMTYDRVSDGLTVLT